MVLEECEHLVGSRGCTIRGCGCHSIGSSWCVDVSLCSVVTRCVLLTRVTFLLSRVTVLPSHVAVLLSVVPMLSHSYVIVGVPQSRLHRVCVKPNMY